MNSTIEDQGKPVKDAEIYHAENVSSITVPVILATWVSGLIIGGLNGKGNIVGYFNGNNTTSPTYYPLAGIQASELVLSTDATNHLTISSASGNTFNRITVIT